MQQSFFFQAMIYLAAAVVMVPVAKRLGLGSVLGYLVAGVIIGPAGLKFIGMEGQDIMHFAEFGVVMMLFVIGLELDPVPAQLDVHPVPFCDPRGEVSHLDVRYVAVAPPEAEQVVSDESLDVRWWPVDDLPELEPSMHDLITIARGRLGVG